VYVLHVNVVWHVYLVSQKFMCVCVRLCVSQHFLGTCLQGGLGNDGVWGGGRGAVELSSRMRGHDLTGVRVCVCVCVCACVRAYVHA